MTPYEIFRRAIRDLNIQAQRDLEAVWRSSGGEPAVLAEILAEVVQTYGTTAAAVAAEWYDDLRADTGVRPGFSAVIPAPAEPGTTALVEWAAAKAASEESLKSLIAGGLQKRITNYSRDVVTTSSIRDPRARGWMRIGSGGCDFCAMLIGRGAVYTKATVDFSSHDHCNCSAAPSWNPAQTRAVHDEFVPSARRRSAEVKAADAERVRQWIDANL